MDLSDAKEMAHRSNLFPSMVMALQSSRDALNDVINIIPPDSEVVALINERVSVVNAALTAAESRAP